MRNAKLLIAVAQAIEQYPGGYNQRTWYSKLEPVGMGRAECQPTGFAYCVPYVKDVAGAHACGTVACIAGWAVALTPLKERRLRTGESVSDAAGRLLGLDEDEKRVLFNGRWRPSEGLSVPDALRCFAAGRNVYSVTN